VGATKAEYLKFVKLFQIVSCSLGGSTGRKFSEVCKYGMNANVGLLINSSGESSMLQTVLILPKKQSRSVENATGNGRK
jgi:hypothetical protein